MEQNPYVTPQVELVDASAARPFLPGQWSTRRLHLLGMLTLSLLFIDLAIIAAGFISRWPGLGYFPWLENWLIFPRVLLGCYVSWYSTLLLEDRFMARGLRLPMLLIIILAVLLQIYSLLADVDFTGTQYSSQATLYLIMSLPGSITLIWYSVRVLRIPEAFASVKVMAWFDLVSALLSATLFLFVFGELVSMFGVIPMALVFLRAAREIEAKSR